MKIVTGKAGRIANFERVVCLRRRNRVDSKYGLMAMIGFQSLLSVGRFMFGIPI
jgi:hypothetical protein